MSRWRSTLVLTLLVGCGGAAYATPASEAEVIGRLSAAVATRDPVRISVVYRHMGEYGRPAAGYVETLINSMGYQHLENGNIETATEIFRLNTDTFPDSADAWDSLAEAVMASGDHQMAMRFYRRSLELDPENDNAALMIRKMRPVEQTCGEAVDRG